LKCENIIDVILSVGARIGGHKPLVTWYIILIYTIIRQGVWYETVQ
jgi:hypothetical protein